MHTSSIEILYDQQIVVHVEPSEAASRNHWGVQAFLDLSDPNLSSYEEIHWGLEHNREIGWSLAQRNNNLNEKKSKGLIEASFHHHTLRNNPKGVI